MKILVIRFSSLGDVILTTALVPNLKARWPDAEITVLTKTPYAAVFDRNPHVDYVRVFDPSRQPFSQLAQEIRDEKFDVIIDLHGNMRSWLIRFMAGAPLTVVAEKATTARRIKVLTKWTPPALSRSVRERILDCLKPLEVPLVHQETQLFPKIDDMLLRTLGIDPGKKLIGVAPGAKHATKRWPPERFAEAANRLAKIPNTMVVIFGDKSDQPAGDAVSRLISAPCVNLTGWTSMPELIGVVSKLSLLLTNDSGIMHVAEALKIPLVAVFGPTVRAFGFAPYRQTSRVVEVVNLKCRPCTLHGDDVCPLKHHMCMLDVDLDAVLFAASPLLGMEVS